MNRVTLLNYNIEPKRQVMPDVSFINLYSTLSPCAGGTYGTETTCRASRARGAPGLILKVTRDENGDFTIEKVEEF